MSKRKIERVELYWLAYLVFLFIEPIARQSLTYWLETLAFVFGFLALYFLFLRQKPNLGRQTFLLICIAALGVWCMPYNGGGTAFLIYASALVPYLQVSSSSAIAAILFVSVIVGAEGLLLHFNPFNIFINVFFTVFVGATNVHFAQKHRADCKLRMQQEEIEALAAVAERERIARDLHDVLGHTLSVIVLKSELANRLLQRELAATDSESEMSFPTASTPSRSQAALSAVQRAQTEIADVERTARTALAEVREAIGGYRSRGLAAEIDTARSTLSAAGVTLHTEGDLHPLTLGAAEETVLALALREAITNIVRHAQASVCRLSIVQDGGRHRLSIEDNGQHAIVREGNGLRGMRERVESLGGSLSLSRGVGTLLTIDLPQRTGS